MSSRTFRAAPAPRQHDASPGRSEPAAVSTSRARGAAAATGHWGDTPRQLQQGRQVAQLLRMDQDDLIDIYHDDSDFNSTINKLDGIRTIEIDRLEFDTGTAIEDKSTSRGLTLPHERPPVVFINHTRFGSQEEIASTLYHEMTHAYDPQTPARGDDSAQAVAQDFQNEANTQIIEAQRALDRGDQPTIDALLRQGKLIQGPTGPVINLLRIQSITQGNYGNYAAVPRRVRFDLNSYRFNALSEFRPGSWSQIIDRGYEADDEGP